MDTSINSLKLWKWGLGRQVVSKPQVKPGCIVLAGMVLAQNQRLFHLIKQRGTWKYQHAYLRPFAELQHSTINLVTSSREVSGARGADKETTKEYRKHMRC